MVRLRCHGFGGVIGVERRLWTASAIPIFIALENADGLFFGATTGASSPGSDDGGGDKCLFFGHH